MKRCHINVAQNLKKGGPQEIKGRKKSSPPVPDVVWRGGDTLLRGSPQVSERGFFTEFHAFRGNWLVS